MIEKWTRGRAGRTGSYRARGGGRGARRRARTRCVCRGTCHPAPRAPAAPCAGTTPSCTRRRPSALRHRHAHSHCVPQAHTVSHTLTPCPTRSHSVPHAHTVSHPLILCLTGCSILCHGVSRSRISRCLFFFITILHYIPFI